MHINGTVQLFSVTMSKKREIKWWNRNGTKFSEQKKIKKGQGNDKRKKSTR